MLVQLSVLDSCCTAGGGDRSCERHATFLSDQERPRFDYEKSLPVVGEIALPGRSELIHLHTVCAVCTVRTVYVDELYVLYMWMYYTYVLYMWMNCTYCICG